MKKIIFILIFLIGCKEKIVSDLDQSKTNQILLALNKYGVEAAKIKEGGTWSIEVAKENRAKALEILAVGRFLNSPEQEQKSSSFVQSKQELEHTLERKLSNSLEETLERMPYVLEARVHISSDETLEFAKTITEKTASVLIVTEPGYELSSEKVQKLISGASGLKQENVIVVNVNAQEPAKIELTSVTKSKLDKNFLILIPILFSSLLVVRRFDSTEKKKKDAIKLLKQDHE